MAKLDRSQYSLYIKYMQNMWFWCKTNWKLVVLAKLAFSSRALSKLKLRWSHCNKDEMNEIFSSFQNQLAVNIDSSFKEQDTC